MEKFDLHIHSTFSDGKKTVAEIIEYAKANEFEYLSITDHDNIDSVEEVKKYDLGNIKYIPGVEISTRYNGCNLHVLCYNFKKTDALKKLMERQKEVRANKFMEIINQLKEKYQIIFQKEDIENASKKSNVGKNDVADLLLKYKHVKTREEAFDQYINTLSLSKIKKVDFLDVVKAAKEDDGILILAHPYDNLERYNITKEELYNLIEELSHNGCKGLEAYHSECIFEDCEEINTYAKNNGLLVTAGSDYHRDDENNIHIGIGQLYKYIDKEEKIDINMITLLDIV